MNEYYNEFGDAFSAEFDYSDIDIYNLYEDNESEQVKNYEYCS